MRWYILRTLLSKEIHRHLANRGGIVLAILLVGIAVLLSLTKAGSQGPLLGGEVLRCYLVYNKDKPELVALVRFLQQQVPAEWSDKQFRIRIEDRMPHDSAGNILYPETAGGIHVVALEPDQQGQRQRFRVHFWYPGDSQGALASYETWFWRQILRYYQSQDVDFEPEYHRLFGSADLVSFMAMALVFFGLFFSCVYLLPSMTCEERERGVLLAQALSPASPLEILAAKFFFYPLAGIGLSALMAGIYRPSILALPFFWLATLASALGSMGIGLTIATLAKTQRLASVGAMCYLLILALFLFTVQQNQIPFVSHLVLEYHSTQILHAAVANSVQGHHWLHLLEAGVVALAWDALAVVLFRRRGWQ